MKAMKSARTKARMSVAVLLAAIAWGSGTSAWAQAADAGTAVLPTLRWGGIKWNIKAGAGIGPGPNNWNPANVFVDAGGDLHLAITNVAGTWSCAELSSDAPFGFGTFQWQVETPVDTLDPNVVLGLFLYGPPTLGPDGTHEIDIEYRRAGVATGDDGRWTVFPNVVPGPSLARSAFALALGADPTTTSRLTWASTSVAFASLGGFQPPGSSTNALQSWTYQPADPASSISPLPMPVHMNLWLANGNAPTNGQRVEVVIHSFAFTPSAIANSVPALPASGVFLLAAGLMSLGLFWVGRSSRRTARR
jgi:hypothetical protein